MTATYKLIILFKQPIDRVDFERRWSEEFVPLAEKLPGLQRVVVAHTHGGPGGPVDIYLVHELHFAGYTALKAAMSSEAGMAAGRCLVRLAPKQSATLLFAEHMEDAPHAGSAPVKAAAPAAPPVPQRPPTPGPGPDGRG